MRPNQKLSYAICSILGVHGGGVALAASASGESSDALSEIVVTAQRRVENIQNVPIQIQALTSETIAELNVLNFDQFIKYLPNVTQSTNGPAQGEIFMRGLSVGGGGGQGGGTTGAFPAVAIYLDEQSGQVPGRNLDVYAADLERIEVLEGPQGTLFGAGAEAGVIRYITNKPDVKAFSAGIDQQIKAGAVAARPGPPVLEGIQTGPLLDKDFVRAEDMLSVARFVLECPRENPTRNRRRLI